MQTKRYSRIIRAFSFLLIVLLLLSGCVGPSGKTEPGKSTDKPSSEQGTSTPSEVVIRTLADQQSEWTEGQFYPGAYQKGSAGFTLPAEPTSFVQESEGVLYAYGNPLNEEGTERIHVMNRIDGLKEKELPLAEIPGDYTLYNLQIKNNTIFILAYPFGMLSDAENSHLELFVYTPEGKFLLREKLIKLLNETKIIDSNVTAFTDNSGNLWVRIPEAGKLYCVQPDGEIAQVITIPTDFQGGFMRGKEFDELVAVLGTGTGLVFWKMDTKTNVSETYTIENLPGIQSVFPGTMYDALVMTEKSLYGVDLGEPVLVKELFSFTDLGVDRTIIRSIEDHEDGSLSALLLERAKTEGEKLSLIPQTTKVREGLTLACLKSNEYLVYAVSTYNTAHPDNKVTIKEYYDKYAVDASEADALNRLNSDLMDGTAGDIVCLDGLNFSGNNAYLKKGLFLDLYELMDQDPEFHKEDYFTDIFRVNETDGKLYRLVPFFTLNTKYGRVDDVGETTHLDESLLFETDPVTNLFGPLYRRTEFIHDLLVFSLGDAQDRDAVLYNTDQMVHYIEVAGKLPEFKFNQGGDYSEEYKDYDEAVSRWYSDLFSGATLFYKDPYFTMNAYFWEVRFASAFLGKPVDRNQWSGMTEEERAEAYRNAGIRLSYSGFPVKNGCGSAVINLFSLAIPAQTDRVGDAWAFLKQSLSESCQSIKRLSQDAVSINKASFEQFVQRLFSYQSIDDDPSYLQFFTVEVGESEPKEEVRYLTPTLQQWMVDSFIDLLGDITVVDEVDRNVEVIVTEEITKYCDGRQTAEEAARNIAERVELYRDEQ
jgi:ABC-type glycerol-3-phosphate transport system substrate-binding protein